MRWFASFYLTLLSTGVIAGLLWLREHPLFGIRETAQALQWLIPEIVAAFVQAFTIPLLFATLLVIRLVLQRVLAYTASATEASPRARPGKRAALGAAAYTLWHNPTRWWLSPFAVVIGIVVGLTGVFVFIIDRGVEARLLWGLTAIFASTITAAMANPDRRQPLRTAPGDEEAVDPVLAVPGQPASE